MATVARLTILIRRVVQERAFIDSEILTYLNEGYVEIAGGILLPTGAISSPLPDLATSGTLRTSSDPYVELADLDDTYQREIWRVVSSTLSGNTYLFTSFKDFQVKHPELDDSGNVRDTCVRGDYLYYKGIPTTADTLTLYYYKEPDALVETTDKPDAIPTHLHEKLLVNYVAKEMLKMIPGADVIQDKYEIRFIGAAIELERFIAKDRAPQNVEADIEDYIR